MSIRQGTKIIAGNSKGLATDPTVLIDDNKISIDTTYSSSKVEGSFVNLTTDQTVDGEKTFKQHILLTGEGAEIQDTDENAVTTVKYVIGKLLNKADATAIPTKVSDLENDAGYTKASDLETLGYYKLYKFNDISVQTTQWKDDTTYTEYPYVAEIALISVTDTMIPNVVFTTSDSISGNYAPVAESYNGGIKIWCKEIPTETLVIPTITCQ